MNLALMIAILVILSSACINVLVIYAWKKSRKRETDRIDRINRDGTPVFATVTKVIHHEGQMNYVVHAKWQSYETGKVYYFQETYRFLRGALKFQPKIQSGDVVQVNVIFNGYPYRMLRKSK